MEIQAHSEGLPSYIRFEQGTMGMLESAHRPESIQVLLLDGSILAALNQSGSNSDFIVTTSTNSVSVGTAKLMITASGRIGVYKGKALVKQDASETTVEAGKAFDPVRGKEDLSPVLLLWLRIQFGDTPRPSLSPPLRFNRR